MAQSLGLGLVDDENTSTASIGDFPQPVKQGVSHFCVIGEQATGLQICLCFPNCCPCFVRIDFLNILDVDDHAAFSAG